MNGPALGDGGSLIVDRWTAWRFEPGEPRPGFLAARDDRWAIADRVAWSPPARLRIPANPDTQSGVSDTLVGARASEVA